ncbi:MAG: methyltransferase, partial [Bacteroidetes bacterium]|nr:methyltransferase [Bacteroidota bacterium]
DHFYFYNAFYENLADVEKIDNTINCSPTLYHYYHRTLYKKLETLPAGTKLVTFHTMEDKIPPDYHVLETHSWNLLKYWIKL